MKAVLLFILIFLVFFIFVAIWIDELWAETASYYTVESCKREGTSGVMANGEPLNDEGLTCASWDFDFGTILMVTNLDNGLSTRVEVTDRGPNKRLYNKGRTIDLSKKAFSEIADLKQGIIQIEKSTLQTN